ncbi:GerAB/ArcD/ProY family transporter [Paenibacillus lignilyticus]|uniref:GerAB/ArcD/ProY family transporter n=1 Tax=Paenibacillus lignilyticus TaxID=1172615 RepID=A0ABS5CCL2_9BACL|nr:GerAB/ArcD/ProY family transporter [Paenibacillus lignilyticus]MBP3961774.1 GerAB/ArcD/ProY family transporter [Paenibacillus lignilyticus]MBP3963555.1 GerAB/ArcD/ProY family transporter [Paenibacillus lignilyticus]
MKMSISKTQLFFLIIKTQIGIGLLSLPSEIQSIANGDSWISVLLAGAIIQILLFVYWRLLKKFPNETLSEITNRLLGRYVGKVINLVYFGFFVFIAAYACSLYVELIHTWMLPLTPGWVLLVLIVGTSVYLAHDNLRVIARFFVLASMLFLVLLLISILNFKNSVHITNILPIGHSGMLQMFRGSDKTFFSMLGFEVTLFFFSHVQDNKKGMFTLISLANCFVTFFYTYFVFICLIGITPKALDSVNEPVLFILKGLSYQLFDRLDLIFLTIWIIPMTATIVSYLCVAGKTITAKESSYRKLVWFSGGIVFTAAWYLSTIENVDSFSKWLEYGYLVMIAAVPVLLWLGSFLVKNNAEVGST